MTNCETKGGTVIKIKVAIVADFKDQRRRKKTHGEAREEVINVYNIIIFHHFVEHVFSEK